MSTIEAFSVSDQESGSESESEPEPPSRVAEVPDFEYYIDERPRNNLLARELTLFGDNDRYLAFILREDAEVDPGVVEIDVNGVGAGRLDKAGKRLFFQRLKLARKVMSECEVYEKFKTTR